MIATRPLLSATLVLLALCCLCGLQHIDASADFVITESPATSTSNAATADLKFLKQFSISADAGGELTALSALALNLPGQVFITYASKASRTAPAHDGTLLGEIKVYASTEALATSVTTTSKRAMKGAKLVVTSNASADTSALVLTEIILLTKNALKKLVANGVGDVVISNDVFFSKKKADYTIPSRRLMRAASENASSSETIRQQQDRFGLSTWAIASNGSSSDATSLNIEVSGDGDIVLQRIDSDLLPEGAVGVVTAAVGTTEVSSTRSNEVGALDTLRVNVKEQGKYAEVFLPPAIKTVDVSGKVRANNLNTTTFLDDALVMLVNGTGSLFVTASSSAVYVDDADFEVKGSGVLQASFKEIFARDMVSAFGPLGGGMMGDRPTYSFTITSSKICMTSSKYGTTIGTYDKNMRPDTPCPAYQVPARSGRSGSPVQVPTSGAAGTSWTLFSAVSLLVATVVLQ